MEEILSSLSDLIKILFGALLALLGSYYQTWIVTKNSKASLKVEKLERAYFLCQSIYDGHKREIENARKNLPYALDKYLEARNHPGEDMSELKMIIRSYAPSLSDSLKYLDDGHVSLKKAFNYLDEIALSKQALIPDHIELNVKIWERHLKALSNGSRKLKSRLEAELNSLVR